MIIPCLMVLPGSLLEVSRLLHMHVLVHVLYIV